MYFGLFPEDHEIKAKSLIRMWVAEGFIPREDRRTMEETAEDYLEELIGRSMIQVSRRHHNGSIKYCRIHDLMRDLAILKGRENRFLEIVQSQDGSCSSSTITMRRAALHCYRDDIVRTMVPNLRSLLFFGSNSYSQNVRRFKLLKILNDDYGDFARIKGDTFRKMVQLRYIALSCYLGFRSYYGYLWWPIRQFRRSMRYMRDLQTLEIPNVELHLIYPDIFDCIWDIKTLRHVILCRWCYGPPSTAHLPNLQTLKVVRKEWLSEGWPAMPNIRVLKLWKFPHNYGESFHTFLSGLNYLTSLHVEPDYQLNWEYEMRDLSVFPWSNLLESLTACGRYTTKAQNDLVLRAITTSSFSVNIIKLKLVWSLIQEDPMPILEKLESLRVLRFVNAYEGRQLSCSSRGFPRLQCLTFEGLNNLKEWKADVAEGAMPVLKEIKINKCPQLRLIPGLHQMTSLTKFTLRGGSACLCQSLREHESHKIRHGYSVDFVIE